MYLYVYECIELFLLFIFFQYIYLYLFIYVYLSIYVINYRFGAANDPRGCEWNYGPRITDKGGERTELDSVDVLLVQESPSFCLFFFLRSKVHRTRQSSIIVSTHILQKQNISGLKNEEASVATLSFAIQACPLFHFLSRLLSSPLFLLFLQRDQCETAIGSHSDNAYEISSRTSFLIRRFTKTRVLLTLPRKVNCFSILRIKQRDRVGGLSH